jgi:hypothetical protein
MSGDLVERLEARGADSVLHRDADGNASNALVVGDVDCAEAAAELRTLRAALAQAVKERDARAEHIERLTAALEVMLENPRPMYATDDDYPAWVTACEQGRASLSADPERGGVGWTPTHRHIKRGTTYRVIGNGSLQTNSALYDGQALVIYEGESGELWARPGAEFHDGRFEKIEGTK